MRRTKEQAAETGRQILRAAEDLFLDKGYDDVSLEEIAAAAGVTRGAVHWHFKNKQGLLHSLRDRAQEPFRQLADDLDANRGVPSLERLGELIAELFGRLQSDPRQKGLLRVMIRLDIALSEKDDGAGTTFREEMYVFLESIFQSIARDVGLPPPWTPKTAASVLAAVVDGFVMEWALGRSSLSLVPEGQDFVRMILGNWRIPA